MGLSAEDRSHFQIHSAGWQNYGERIEKVPKVWGERNVVSHPWPSFPSHAAAQVLFMRLRVGTGFASMASLLWNRFRFCCCLPSDMDACSRNTHPDWLPFLDSHGRLGGKWVLLQAVAV